MILTITDCGDDSVGIFPQSWNIDCPFEKEDTEELEPFRKTMMDIYAPFADGRIDAYYDFEIKDFDILEMYE